jgi:hypothetical protein
VAEADAAAFQGVELAGLGPVRAGVQPEMQVVDGPHVLAVGIVDVAADQLGGSHPGTERGLDSSPVYRVGSGSYPRNVAAGRD